MKITIAYQGEEAREAHIILACIKSLIPGIKSRMSNRHDPFRHIYVTSKERPATGTDSKKP